MARRTNQRTRVVFSASMLNAPSYFKSRISPITPALQKQLQLQTSHYEKHRRCLWNGYGKSKKKNYTNRISECKGNGLKRDIYTILSDSEINTENLMVIDYFKKNKKEDILDTIYNDFLSKYSHYDNNKLKSFVNLWITRKQLNRIRNKKTVKFNNH